MVSSLAKKVRGSTADTDRICSNRRSRENKHGNSMPESVGSVCASTGPIYHEGGSWKQKLLQL